MRWTRRPLLPALVGLAVLGPAAAAPSAWASVGGAAAPTDQRAGGAEYGILLGRPSAPRPAVAAFRVAPHTLVSGRAPRLAVQITQRGVRTVTARIVFRPVHGNGTLLELPLGQVRTERLLRPAWPASSVLAPGRYVVSLHATGPAGGTLLRRAQASGRVPITVRPRPVAPTPAPVVAPAPTPPPLVAPVVPPLPDPGVTPDGAFPVAGPHSYGGDDARFGTGRVGHSHQGQDVLADEGTPVVAPLAGTIIARDYQASAAGFYLAMDAADGRSFFFAHCQKDTFAVTLGQTVAAGQQLCRVGHTGDATGPHLHFEIWIGGWRRSSASYPVDPLAQLQAWDH
ncbi:M23 family metallopeptidase [Baekduia soli]|uniref:M23 family metallopeptidase n=1 Tax=Baekduia soli TaxID=496014 RepID=A0A5B8U030_9ACTN|nr:M23 family metallopeptidase [Baekduia soli]QEC46328.1 M23 family metallopeptidase [Baekduia soli]